MKKDKLLEKFGKVLLSSIIIIFSLIIGANERGLRVLPISILLLLIIIFLVCKKITNKKESIFFKNKIDIMVSVFILTTFLPLIFNTYSSLSFQIEFMIKYIFYYAVYVLSRNVIKTKKDINMIYPVIIFTSLIPIILGLDIINGNNIFSPIVDFFNIAYQDGYKPVFTFGYSNVMAIYLALCIFLSIYKINNTKDKLIKTIYILYILIAVYIIYLCYSRMPSILLIIFLMIYFINRNKDKLKVYKKKIITIGIISVVVLIPILSFALTKSKPFTTSEKEYEKQIIYNFKKDEKYKIKIDVDFSNSNNNSSNYVYFFKIADVNKYYKETILTSNQYNKGHHTIEYDYVPTKDTESIRLYFDNTINGQITINNIYINDKEYIAYYKYLPQKISKFVSFMTLKDQSIVERFYFYKDSLKIFKKHPILGNGGNAWRSLSKTKQDYTFSVKETHSYFFELLIEYGLIGIIAYFTMLISILISLFKNKKEEKKILKYALGILLLHSITFDFNMSFMFIEIIVYVLFACIVTDEKKKKIKKNVDYPIIIIFIITLITTTYMTLYKYNIISKDYYIPINRDIIEKRLKDIDKENISVKDKIKFLKTTMTYEPYLGQNYVYQRYFNIVLANIKNKDMDKYLDYIIEHLDRVDIYSPLYIDTLFEREYIIYDSIITLKNSDYKYKDKYINKLKKIFNDNYCSNLKIFNDSERTGYSIYQIKDITEKYQNMSNEINS